MNSTSTADARATLSGSWRNFSPRLSPEVARVFKQIEEDTLEALRQAGQQADRLMEEPPEPPMPRP